MKKNGVPWFMRLLKVRLFGKSPLNAFLGLNQRLWNRFSFSLSASRPIGFYGIFLHRLARIRDDRAQALSTFFLRNRPALELIGRLMQQKQPGDTVRVAVLGCSAGAEVYSVAWRIRRARPDLKLRLSATDISSDAVEFAKRGVYSHASSPLTTTPVLERMSPAEMEEMFERDGDAVKVKPCLREGINWYLGDVGDPGILDVLGPQDLVVANNFLCHMADHDAERCLRNIARLVAPHEYLFVSGIDLDVRTKVARELGWEPVPELLEKIHGGDPCMTSIWPCHYGALEPLDKRRRDWETRYAAFFRIPPLASDFASNHNRFIEAASTV